MATETTIANRVYLTIPRSATERGLWNRDSEAKYAILMHREDGTGVWLRSCDWALYGRQYGWHRVARLAD